MTSKTATEQHAGDDTGGYSIIVHDLVSGKAAAKKRTTASKTTFDAVALRDAAGVWYLLTPEMLAQARAATEQRAVLEQQFGDDTAGFGVIINDLVPVELPAFEPPPETPGVLPPSCAACGADLAKRSPLIPCL